MTPTVLVVDDSLTVRMDLASALEAEGLRVVQCATAAEARDALAREPTSAVILDVVLPDTDGIELLREIRATPATASMGVLLLSSEAEVKDRIRGLETGANEYVGKPYDRRYVVARAVELAGSKSVEEADDRSVVLVIDDSATFRDVLRRALEAEGYAVVLAETGEIGLQLAAARRPSAVIVDGVLPGIDGPSTIRRLRLDAALRDVPCILLTASDAAGGELGALDAGADAFVRKEEDVSVVLARLGAVLRRASGGGRPAPSSTLGPKKILAVDDSPTYLHTLGDALRRLGYDVALARSGEEALELLAVEPVDCILLDLMMPGMGGQEACRRIKAAPGVRDVPLVMLTALDDRDTLIAGLAAGADDFVMKSADFEVLGARMRAQIRRRQLEEETRDVRERLLEAELAAAGARAARELADTRAALVEQLEWKNEELEAFSYSVSHDLRAPLRAVNGFCQALLEDCAPQLDDVGKRHLERVMAAARRMGDLIDGLLDLSRVGRAEFVREPVDLSEIASAVLADLARQSPERSVEARVAGGLGADADRRLMTAALNNLIGNAWKFTAKVDGARIEVGADREDPNVVYFVRDNGAGFDPSYADRLFAPFQRLHSAADFAGTGIGLATVKRIVERHGGRVWAESSPGSGATFRFTLARGSRT